MIISACVSDKDNISGLYPGDPLMKSRRIMLGKPILYHINRTTTVRFTSFNYSFAGQRFLIFSSCCGII